MRLVIGMTHAPRKKCFTSYTIDSLLREGFYYPIHVQEEPDAQRFRGYSKCSIIKNTTKLNVWYNFITCMENILNIYYVHDDGYILYVEDDVELKSGAGGAFRAFFDFRIKRVGFFSLYTSLVNANKKISGWGLACVSAHGWCGNLCLCIQTQVLRQALPLLRAMYEQHPGEQKAIDYDLGHVIKDLGLDIWCHNPNLVTHLGAEHSTIVDINDVSNLQHKVRQPYDYPSHRTEVQYQSFSGTRKTRS
jgi:hypothetical protein